VARFDRYMLSQLLVLFGFFSLILVLVYWINRAVSLFDAILGDGQSALVFVELTLLTLPGIIRIVIPLAGFAAAVYVTNRLSSESELTVVQATGYSPLRLARPVVVFGLFVAALGLVLTHILVPMSTERLKDREAELSRNMTARLLTPGEFTTPGSGTTFYIRDITPEGELRDIFLSDSRDPAATLTYTAGSAYLVRTEFGPQLVMLDGLVQRLDRASERLTTSTFKDFAYDIGALIPAEDGRRRSYDELTTGALLTATPAVLDEVRRSPADLRALVHERSAEAALGLVGPLLGFAALMVGGFSRFGLGRQMLLAVMLVVIVKVLESIGTKAARSDPTLWPMLYLHILAGLAMAASCLAWAIRPRRVRKAVPA